MTNVKNIYPIWKKKGESTHQLAKALALKLGVKTAHTGTLDPMAEGVIIILANGDRLKKYEYAKWLKTYEFEMTLGISTDTYDGLGLVTNIDLDNNTAIATVGIAKILTNFKGMYEQEVPPYSAIKVKGKPLHYWARENKLHELHLPKRNGEIIDISLLSIEKKKLKAILIKQIEVIKKIDGDLRQKEILEQWEEYVYKYNKVHTTTIRIMVKMTKGLYVRKLGMDILKELGMRGFISDLIRIENGVYNKRNIHP